MAIGPATPVEVEVEVEVDLEVEVEVEVDLEVEVEVEVEVDLEVEVEVDLEVEVEVDLEVEAVSFWLGQVLLARMSDEFAHEALDCYKLAVKLSRWAACQVFPPHRKHVRPARPIGGLDRAQPRRGCRQGSGRQSAQPPPDCAGLSS